jgi:hypothetical protein
MEQHFVTYYSPGTFVAETSIRKIDSWNVDEAMRVARSIGERYSATPYGFKFSTRSRGEDDLDSRVTKESPMYYLGGKVETLADVKARATEKDRILVSNMEGNGYRRIITNDNSWRWTQPLNDDDIVLDYEVGKASPAVEQDGGTVSG